MALPLTEAAAGLYPQSMGRNLHTARLASPGFLGTPGRPGCSAESWTRPRWKSGCARGGGGWGWDFLLLLTPTPPTPRNQLLKRAQVYLLRPLRPAPSPEGRPRKGKGKGKGGRAEPGKPLRGHPVSWPRPGWAGPGAGLHETSSTHPAAVPRHRPAQSLGELSGGGLGGGLLPVSLEGESRLLLGYCCCCPLAFRAARTHTHTHSPPPRPAPGRILLTVHTTGSGPEGRPKFWAAG